MLRSRKVKQYDVLERITKGKHCKFRCTSKVAFSFSENADTLKDFVAKESISIAPFTLEWGCTVINLQEPLQRPGIDSGLLLTY